MPVRGGRGRPPFLFIGSTERPLKRNAVHAQGWQDKCNGVERWKNKRSVFILPYLVWQSRKILALGAHIATFAVSFCFALPSPQAPHHHCLEWICQVLLIIVIHVLTLSLVKQFVDSDSGWIYQHPYLQQGTQHRTHLHACF